jgi:hypothetical protein
MKNLFLFPGKFLAEIGYLFPKRGELFATKRRRESGLVHFFYASFFWIAVGATGLFFAFANFGGSFGETSSSQASNGSLFDGTKTYDVSYNDHGAVLSTGRERIYLGRNCDAASKNYGGGSWGQANGGVLIKFKQTDIAFARQSIDLPNVECDVR